MGGPPRIPNSTPPCQPPQPPQPAPQQPPQQIYSQVQQREQQQQDQQRYMQQQAQYDQQQNTQYQQGMWNGHNGGKNEVKCAYCVFFSSMYDDFTELILVSFFTLIWGFSYHMYQIILKV